MLNMSMCYLMQASFIMLIYKNNQPDRNHVDDFHGSNGPTLKGLTKGFDRERKTLSRSNL